MIRGRAGRAVASASVAVCGILAAVPTRPAQAGSGVTAELVKQIKPGAQGGDPSSLADVNGTLYFAAGDGPHGEELWRSDGTNAGTRMVKDITPGGKSVEGRSSFPRDLTAVNGALYFTADDDIHGRYELWRSAGTRARTKLVRDIEPGHEGSDPQDLTAVDGVLYFNAADDKHGRELWRTVRAR